jgi:hypothetical protein
MKRVTLMGRLLETWYRLRHPNVPEEWHREEGDTGPCPACGSLTCKGYYKPDGNHFLAF